MKTITNNQAPLTFSQPDWEKYAVCYDSLLEIKPYTSMLQTVAREALNSPRGSILDASCGTGNFEKVLFDERKEEVDITGIDTSCEMLTRAKQKCSLYSSVHFLNADLNNVLPFNNDSFDQIVSINTLYAVSNPEKTLCEFHRVINKEGRLLIVTPKHGYENGLILKSHCNSSLPDEYWTDAHANSEREEKLIREAINDEEVIQNMLTVAKYNRSIAGNCKFHFFSLDTLIELLEKNGFNVKNHSVTYANQSIFITATKS